MGERCFVLGQLAASFALGMVAKGGDKLCRHIAFVLGFFI